MQKESVKLYVNGVFGDITIILPKDIAVSARTSAVAGDLTIRGKRKDGLFPNLSYSDSGFETANRKFYLRGSIVFGSVNVY
jgi:predicted membrane protein